MPIATKIELNKTVATQPLMRTKKLRLRQARRGSPPASRGAHRLAGAVVHFFSPFGESRAAFLARNELVGEGTRTMSGYQNGAREQLVVKNTRCVLRRRQPKVVVRAPDATPGSFPKVGRDRRARVTTLVGLGAREAMPTLFDFDVGDDEPTQPRVTVVRDISHDDTDANLALVQWDDDEDTTCFDV